MINNRQAGRRRGRGGQQQRPQGNSGRPDNGNRIDNRSRGNAAQLLEKYKSLARDSQMQGDRVNTEYYLQFADHYFRVLAETRSRFEENRQPAPGGANTFQDDEQDYDDDGEPVARVEQPRQPNGGDRQSNGNGAQHDEDRRPRNNNNGEGDRDRYARDDRGNDRGDRQNNDRSNNERNADRQPRQYNDRAERNGNSNDRGDRYERQDRPERNDRSERAPREAAPQEDHAAVADNTPQTEEAPRRRGRPRREPAAEAPAFEADRLPPSLSISAVVPDDAAPAEEKPRRRRVTRPAASDETTAAE